MHWGVVGAPGKYEKVNLCSDKIKFIEKLHLMIPFQFCCLGVGDNPTFEIDIVLLLNITRKIAKVSYQWQLVRQTFISEGFSVLPRVRVSRGLSKVK